MNLKSIDNSLMGRTPDDIQLLQQKDPNIGENLRPTREDNEETKPRDPWIDATLGSAGNKEPGTVEAL